MQMDKRSRNSESEREVTERAEPRPVHPRASVWVDPMAPHTPSASHGIKEQRNIPNPQTPIPMRASAQPVKVRPRYPHMYTDPHESDVTRIPTMPEPTIWQYESPDFDAESSLASLSLARPKATITRSLAELDTLPPPRARALDEQDTQPPPSRAIAEQDTRPPVAARPIDEQDTTPPRPRSIDELDTQPPPRKQNTLIVQKSPVPAAQKSANSQAYVPPTPRLVGEVATLSPVLPRPVPLSPALSPMPVRIRPTPAVIESMLAKRVEEAASWTTGPGQDSVFARRIASRAKDKKGQRKSTLSLNPVDRVRWWLLYPGRIEFLLWLNGTILLFVITCLLLFATVLSVGWLHLGDGNGAQTPLTSVATPKPACTTARCRSTPAPSSGLQLTLVDNALLQPTTPIALHGQGFSANAPVTLTYDAHLPCRPNAVQTDTHGMFTVVLTLANTVSIGTHRIAAYDTASKRTITVTVSIGAATKATPVPSIQPAYGVTPPATTGGGQGSNPAPVGQTPVPVKPTVGVTPTVAATQPPTPTVGATPQPTIGTTPTTSTTTPPTTTSKQHETPALALKNTLSDGTTDGHGAGSTWVWLAVVGYLFSMTMLGVAGVLYRRKRRSGV